MSFQYLTNYTGPPVATSLPVTTRSAAAAPTGSGLPPFFAGLLPEGYRLNLLRAAVKTSLDDEFSMLLAIGSDLPGDVQVVPSGQIPKEPPTAATIETPDSKTPPTQRFADLFQVVDSIGIAGVQAKVSAQMITTTVSYRTRPPSNQRGDGAISAILKLNPTKYPHLIENEAFHLQHAPALKLPVVKGHLITDIEGEAGLVVPRFDRHRDGRRFALEDASQLLGVLPAKKYSVSAEEVVDAVKKVVSAQLPATRSLFIQFLFAWLTGNGDLHAKNISVLQGEDGAWKLSPIYDIPSTLFYEDNTMALPLSGVTKNLRARHWRDFGRSIGLPEASLRSATKLVLKVTAAMDYTELPFGGSILNGAIRELRHRQYEAEKLLA